MQLYSCRADSGDWALGGYFNTQIHVICHNLLMCGRYRLSRRKEIIEEHFTASGQEDWIPRFNIATLGARAR